MPFRPAETIDIPAADGLPIRGDLYAPLDGSRGGLVILCHGFKGYRSWGFLPYLASRLADAGMAALSIDYSLDGDLGGVVRPDLFRRNTIRRELADLEAVLRPLVRGRLGSLGDGRIPVGLFGHSRGGVVAALAACANEPISALVTWSCPARPDRFTSAQKERWRHRGEYDFTDSRSGTRLSLSTEYLDDLETNRDAYDLVRRAAALRVPHLIVHGEADLAVPAADASALHEAERDLRDKKLVLIRTGHTFGVDGDNAVDPDNAPRPLVEACRETVLWFSRRLQKGH